MKRILRILAISLSLFCICLSSTACWFWGNFNGVMYKHFKDPNNYYEWTVMVKDCVWTDVEDDYKAYSLFNNSENFEYKALEERKYNYIALSTTILEYEEEWMDYIKEEAFTVHYKNAVELIENGFLENVKIGDTITIRATHCTYSDANFLYVAAVEKDGVTYLDMQTGLKNITEYMDGNRSLL